MNACFNGCYLKIFVFQRSIFNRTIMLLVYLLISCSSPKLEKNRELIKKLRITAVGDVMVHSTQIDTAYNRNCDCYNFQPGFEKLRKYVLKSDISIANLETTLPGKKNEYSGYPLFGAPDSLLDALKETGFQVLTTSNNHCLDKGKSGFLRTLEIIQQRGMVSTGTFPSETHRLQNPYLLIDKNNLRVAILSYTYGTNGIPIPKGISVNVIDKEKIANDISHARESGVDFILVYYHFGNEYERYPNKSQIELVDFTFLEGADIVLGGHPHVIQPYELKITTDRYGNSSPKLVIYSLGNFISSQYWRYSNGGILFSFTISRNGTKKEIGEIDFEPVYVYRHRYPDRLEFQLLPVREYLDEVSNSFMNPTYKKQMLEFYSDTVQHLGR